MPRYICKLQKGKKSYYLEWSTVVDAPVTVGMSLKDFKDYYCKRYGNDADDLDERLERVEAKGTSSRLDSSVEELMEFNRAGKDETSLTLEQIIDFYCVKGGEGEAPLGKKHGDEE